MNTIKPPIFRNNSCIERDELIQEIVESALNGLKPFLINHVDILLGDCESRPTPEQVNLYKMVMIEYLDGITAQQCGYEKLN